MHQFFLQFKFKLFLVQKTPNLQQFFAALAKNLGACVAQHEFVMAKASLRGWLLNKAAGAWLVGRGR